MLRQSGEKVLMGEEAIAFLQKLGHDEIKWRAHAKLEKYNGKTLEEIVGENSYETLEVDGNLLVTNGANLLWTALTGGAITAFSNANARIGVGDSTTAEAVGQTDLQAASNKLRKAMDATYPQVSTNTVIFKSSFVDADADYHWQEWAIFNAASGATSMLNRKVQDFGTKVTGTWVLTITLTLA